MTATVISLESARTNRMPPAEKIRQLTTVFFKGRAVGKSMLLRDLITLAASTKSE